MPSRFVRTLFVLAALSSLGLLAPGRAIAEPTPEQRAQWIRQIKLSFAQRRANEGLQESREREARAGDESQRRAIEAGVAVSGAASPSQEQTDGLRLEAPAWFSLSSGASASQAPDGAATGPTVPPRGPSRERAIGARQVRVPEGSAAEGRGDPSTSERVRAASGFRTEAAQGLATNIRVSDPSLDNPQRADAQSETAIATYQNYVLAAWNESRSTGHSPIGYAYSTNGGQTFVTGGWPAEGDNDVVWTSDPVLTVNAKTGEFYFSGLVDPVDASGGPQPHGVAVLRGTFFGSTFTWDNSPHIASSTPEPNFIDKPWVAADSLTGNLYLCYTKFVGGADSIMVQRSTNSGASWSPATALSRAPRALVQGSRVAVGPDGEVYATWEEIRPDSAADIFRIRKSTNFGVTWSPEITATQLFDNFGTGAPNFNRELGISFPSITVDHSSGPRRGRVYLAWNETVDYLDSPPDTTQTPVHETEGNDTTSTANAFTPGQTLAGDYNNANDFDYWSFDATQGSTYIFLSSSTNLYTMRIFCTDGFTRLAFSGDRFGPVPGDGLIVWTAPATGRYYLRLAVVEGASGSYTVWTSVDNPGGPTQRSRDTRDIFVRSSPDGANWSSPAVRVNTDALGFDDWLPEIAASGSDLYVAWFDFSEAAPSTCGGESNVSIARSTDGGASWVQLGPVTDAITAWTRVNSDIIPNQGDYIALVANPAVVYPSWADGRCSGVGCVSTPDVMAAPFVVNGLKVVVSGVVVDTAHAAITWQISGATVSSATLYRRVGTGLFQPIATLTPTGSQLFYDDTDVQKSTQQQYRLGIIVNATEVTLGEQTVQIPGPTPPALAFEGAFPNPTPGPLTLSFTLPTTEPAWLTVFDAGGRKVRETDVSPLGAGRHTGVALGPGLTLRPGVYLVRLRQGSLERSRRVVVIP